MVKKGCLIKKIVNDERDIEINKAQEEHTTCYAGQRCPSISSTGQYIVFRWNIQQQCQSELEQGLLDILRKNIAHMLQIGIWSNTQGTF
jgi:hypothetical protein